MWVYRCLGVEVCMYILVSVKSVNRTGVRRQ